MKIEFLAAHGFSQRTLENWRNHGTTELLPLQREVCSRTGLLRGENLLVFAPTSSGKTFVGELAAARHAERGFKTVFLSPTKALAEEQFAHLSRVYSGIGLRTVIATRERTSHDDLILTGRYDFAVMVYEKLKAFLAVSPAMIDRVGAVVVDELQILGDPERGHLVDVLLGRLATWRRPIQLVCLSAVLGENTRLAAWLKSECFVWRERPVELREGVLRATDGIYSFREQNSGREETEQLLAIASRLGSGRPEDFSDPASHHFPAVDALTRTLTAGGEQVLVFVPTRHLSRHWAFELARSLELPAVRSALDDLEQYEENHSRDVLEECLRGGVAFHNSDLPHDIRALIERGFKSGDIQVLIATSTLSQGVNLTCRNVISVPVMVAEGTGRAGSGPVEFTGLSRQRFRNQGGRAGRLGGATSDFGRSILIASDEAEADRLMREYVLSDVEPLEAPMRPDQFDELVLDLVHAGSASTVDALTTALLGTYTGLTVWAANVPELRRLVDASVQRLLDAHLIRAAASGGLETTGMGQAAAAFGIATDTARDFISFARNMGDRGTDEMAVLALCAFSRDGADFALAPSKMELSHMRFPAMLEERAGHLIGVMPDPVRSYLTPEGGFAHRDHAALKRMLVAEAWISADQTSEVEERFRVFAGTMANLGAHLGWLCQALATVAAAGGVNRAACRQIADLAHRLPDGVGQECLPLVRLGAPGLGRGQMAALLREGLDTPEAIASAGEKGLARLLPAVLAGRLYESACARLQQEQSIHLDLFEWMSGETPIAKTAPKRARTPAPIVKESGALQLQLDTASPGQIVFRGTELTLTGMPFQLLELLARTPRRVVPYAEIDNKLWPDSKVEPQQIGFHRSRIVEKLAEVCGRPEASRLIRTRSRLGLYLDIPPYEVAVE